MNEVEIRKLLKKYIKGESSSDENSLIEDWYLKEVSVQKFPAEHIDFQEDKKEILKLIQNNIQNKKPAISYLKQWYIAASVALIVCIGTVVYILQDYINPVIYSYLETSRGSVKKITLPDGSVVFLNSGSKLKYPQSFNRAVREVTLLEGEAYLEVQHNIEKPFILVAGGIRTEVLGTKFNVRSYTEMEMVQVTVVKGKVCVENKSYKKSNPSQTFLLPNEQASIDKRTNLVKKEKVIAKNMKSWTEGKLVFNNESFHNIATILENKFDVDIIIEDPSIENYHVSAEFTQKDQLADILTTITLPKKLKYTLHNKQVIFKKNL